MDQGAQAQLLPWSQAGSHRVPLCQAGAHQGLPQGRPGRLGQKAHWARPVHPELLRESRDQGISLTPHSSSPPTQAWKAREPPINDQPTETLTSVPCVCAHVHFVLVEINVRKFTKTIHSSSCSFLRRPHRVSSHSRWFLSFYSDFKGWCFYFIVLVFCFKTGIHGFCVFREMFLMP